MDPPGISSSWSGGASLVTKGSQRQSGGGVLGHQRAQVRWRCPAPARPGARRGRGRGRTANALLRFSCDRVCQIAARWSQSEQIDEVHQAEIPARYAHAAE